MSGELTLEGIREKLKHELNPFERITDLLSGRDDRLDTLITLQYYTLEAILGQELSADITVPGVTLPASMGVVVPLQVRQVDLMKNIASLTTDEISPQRMADCRLSLRVILVVNNTFDQQVSVSVIGNGSEASDSAFVIHTMNVASGARGAYGIKSEEWMPYLGVKVTPAANPTGGTINAVAIIQDQKVGS